MKISREYEWLSEQEMLSDYRWSKSEPHTPTLQSPESEPESLNYPCVPFRGSGWKVPSDAAPRSPGTSGQACMDE